MHMNYRKLLTFMCIFFLSPSINAWFNKKDTFLIMLDPAGDAQHTGRIVHSAFERTNTLQCAEYIKHTLFQCMPSCSVIISRRPGDIIQPLQNASLANRSGVDLYISLHCYQHNEIKPSIDLYYFSYGNAFVTRSYDLALYPYDEAHLCNTSITKAWAHFFAKTIHTILTERMIIRGPDGIPFHPLIGITAPAIGIEMGIKKESDWQLAAQALAKTIQMLTIQMGLNL